MKFFMLILILLTPVVNAGPTVATVDAQFAYGFDVTWEHKKFRKLLRPGTPVSVEWSGGKYRTTVNAINIGWSGKVGIIYVTYTPPELPVPAGAIIKVVR